MRPSRFPVLWFFVLTYVLHGVGQWVHFFVTRRIMAAVTSYYDPRFITWACYDDFITNVDPSVVGLLLTLFLYGFPGLRRLILQLAPRSANRAWPVLLVCLLLPLAVIVLPLTILAALGASVPLPSWQLSEYLYGAVIGGGFLGPGLCEEIGWRGFALPHLQRRYSALASSLIIGLAWAFWHWPNFVFSSESPPWWAVLVFILWVMAVSVLFTWVYNSTGGSLFAVVVLHGAIHTALMCREAVSLRLDLIFQLLFAVIAVGLVWRYGAANLSLRERVVAHPPKTCVSPSGESGGI
jgi:membrane protease YdiL (CAAX protease family)